MTEPVKGEASVKEYTLEEVSKHTTTDSCWLVIGNSSNGEYVLRYGFVKE